MSSARATLRQYFDLTKPRVVALIVFTAIVGMFLAVPGLPPLQESVLGFLGIWLAASSAAAINQILDSRIDAQMARTNWRPIVVGQVTPRQALVFALVLAARLVRIPGVRGWATLLGVATLVQVGLGIANVKFSLPLGVAVAHVGGAVVLLFVLVSLLARLRSPEH